MNKRQRKKVYGSGFYRKRKKSNRVDFLVYSDVTRPKLQIAHKDLDYIFTYGYLDAIRCSMKRIARINAKKRCRTYSATNVWR